jgi:hypothetical protein
MHVALLFLALLSVWLARPLTAQTWQTADVRGELRRELRRARYHEPVSLNDLHAVQ